MPDVDLLAREGSAQTRAQLSEFISALRDDLQASPDSWENPILDRYLGAMAAWVHDMPGYFKNKGIEEPAQPSWALLATMLHAAKIYE